jgi:hypothetical protein
MAYYCAKSGCSSLRNFFVEAHKKELPEEAQKDITVHNANLHFCPPENLDISKVKKMVLVRNPYTRAVSMYMNKFIGPNSHIKKNMKEKGVSNPVKGESFFSFLKILEHLKKNDMLNKVDGHMYEQVYNLPSDESIKVVKLENMEEELGEFFNTFPTKELFNKAQSMFKKDDMHINKTKTKTKTKDKATVNVTHHEFKEEKAVAPPYEAFFNSEARELVYQIYKDDFKRFGYKKELPF